MLVDGWSLGGWTGDTAALTRHGPMLVDRMFMGRDGPRTLAV